MKLPDVKSGTIVEPMPDEVLVCDPGSGRVHCLNSPAGMVFQACREQWGRARTVALLARSAGVEVSRAETMLDLALRELSAAGLLTDSPKDGLSRRDLLRRCATTAAALPAVVSLTAPAAAQAASFCCLPGDALIPGSCGDSPPADCSCRCSPDASLDCSNPDRLCVRVHRVLPGGDCTVEFAGNGCTDGGASATFHPDCATARQNVVDTDCGGDDSVCAEFYFCCQCAE